jgi:Tol biopolymer transport system component
VPVVLCLLGALIGFGTPAAGRSSKDLRLAYLDFSARQDIFTVDPGLGHGNGRNSSGPPERITTGGEVLQLRWSPAGNLFAIMSPENTIVVMEPDGSDPRIVATDDASLGEFSPDGGRLALVRFAGGRNDIWIVDLVEAGFSPVVTFAGDGFTSHLVWSSDGKWLAFDRTDCPGGTGCGDPHVIVADADGTARHTVATGTDPSWSPNNKQLAFSGPLGEVRIASAAGGQARTIATRTLGAPTVLAWQPKGNLIAYFTGDQNPLEDTFSIATVRRDGKKLDSLPLPGFSAIDLAWSPNGKDIAFGAFYETPDGFGADVFGVDEDLDTLRNLTNRGTAFGAEWAPPSTARRGGVSVRGS